MIQPALIGTYPHSGLPGAAVTCGREHVVPWLQQHLPRPRPVTADIETYGVDLDGYRIKCVTIATETAALVLDPRDYDQAVMIGKALGWASTIFAHNAPFDIPSLVLNGLMGVADVAKVVDTLVMARMLWPGDMPLKSLEACAGRLLGTTTERTIKDVFKARGLTRQQGFATMDIDSPVYLMGAAADGIVTTRLAPVLHEKVLDYWVTGHPFADQGLSRDEAAAEMEKHQIENRWGIRQTIRGLAPDLEYLEAYQARHGHARNQAASKLEMVGITPGNGNHLTSFLEVSNGLPPDYPRTAGGKWKSDKAALATLDHPAGKLFAEVKKLDKITGYLEKVRTMSLFDGRIHPTLNVLKAAHGRSSMSGVEIHQFPADARPIIGFDEEGASVDWAQQEPMLGMNFAGDEPALLSYEAGEKIYNWIAQYGNIPYKMAKIVLLAGMYGEGLRKLSIDLGLDLGPWEQKRDWTTRQLVVDEDGDPVMIPTYAAGKAMQAATFSGIPRTWTMLGNLKRVAKVHHSVISLNGRILPIPMGPGFDGGPPSRQTHKGPNYRICGSASDMKTDVIVAAEAMGIGDGIWFNMHDEFVCAASVAHDVQLLMQRASDRLCRAAGRTPVIRTDLEILGRAWRGEEK